MLCFATLYFSRFASLNDNFASSDILRNCCAKKCFSRIFVLLCFDFLVYDFLGHAILACIFLGCDLLG